jgi:hypothetical protein
MIEAGMRLSADLAESVGLEEAEIAGERNPHADGECPDTNRTRLLPDLGEEPIGDAAVAEVRMDGEAPEVESVAIALREHTAHQTCGALRDQDPMIPEGGRDRLGCLAERARFRLELSAVFDKGRLDERSHRGAFLRCGRADHNLRSGFAQTVCSGKRSSEMKLLNLVVLPSKRSMTLSMGPWRCFATMISALP